ncbi:MAG: cobalamin-dependent protein [Dehalococcoidia bacterium]|nr:cobalamin-dependent protein [Dehalococcoidia bacterium]
MTEKIRAIIAKPGLDGHEMGARLIARVLMNAGVEVIYTGPRQTPQMVVAAAVQEGADVVGLSFLTGAHKEHTEKIVRLMKANKIDDIVLVVGGIIPAKDIDHLKSLGVEAVFGPGSDTRVITQTIFDAVLRRRGF